MTFTEILELFKKDPLGSATRKHWIKDVVMDGCRITFDAHTIKNISNRHINHLYFIQRSGASNYYQPSWDDLLHADDWEFIHTQEYIDCGGVY